MTSIYDGLTGSRQADFNVPKTGFGTTFERKLIYDEAGLHRPKLLNSAIDYSSRRGVLMCDNSLREHQLRTPIEHNWGKPQNMNGGGLFGNGFSAKRLIPAHSADAGAVSKLR